MAAQPETGAARRERLRAEAQWQFGKLCVSARSAGLKGHRGRMRAYAGEAERMRIRCIRYGGFRN